MSTSTAVCPICGEGPLRDQVSRNIVSYKEREAELELRSSVCEACGSEQSDAAQLRANKRAMIAFRKRVDGLLSGAEVRALRERLGISQAEAARIFGGGPVAFSKYESNDVAQSEAMDRLLRLVAELPEAFEYMKCRAESADVKTGLWRSVLVALPHVERHAVTIVSSSCPEPERIWETCA